MFPRAFSLLRHRQVSSLAEECRTFSDERHASLGSRPFPPLPHQSLKSGCGPPDGVQLLSRWGTPHGRASRRLHATSEPSSRALPPASSSPAAQELRTHPPPSRPLSSDGDWPLPDPTSWMAWDLPDASEDEGGLHGAGPGCPSRRRHWLPRPPTIDLLRCVPLPQRSPPSLSVVALWPCGLAPGPRMAFDMLPLGANVLPSLPPFAGLHALSVISRPEGRMPLTGSRRPWHGFHIASPSWP
jgi:hypothetical protein